MYNPGFFSNFTTSPNWRTTLYSFSRTIYTLANNVTNTAKIAVTTIVVGNHFLKEKGALDDTGIVASDGGLGLSFPPFKKRITLLISSFFSVILLTLLLHHLER